MSFPVIDSHIHLDMYEKDQQSKLLQEMEEYQIDALIAVSNHIASAKETWKLAQSDSRVHAAFGFHPEQQLPSESELADLFSFCREHTGEMVAVGEVGLPYYLRKETPDVPLQPYLDLLESFIAEASALDKPVILHAIYEDAPLVCDLLEKHSIKKAHFHWFKGDPVTIQRIISNGYYISVTPDCIYEKEIQELIKLVPLPSLMTETDGPWPFTGPFENKLTHPNMIHDSISKIAAIHQLPAAEVYRQLYQNAKTFYRI